MNSERGQPVRLGVAGLGRGFMLTLPSLTCDRRVALVAAAAPREESRRAFVEAFGGRAYESVAALCDDPEVEAVYIATPHEMHAEHVALAAAAGKHVLVEKPIATSLAEAQGMIEAASAAGVHLIVGPSHSFDGPVDLARTLLAQGGLGEVRMVQSFNYTDFLVRPRRPEELDTARGGGVVFSQAVHQVDVVRSLIPSAARTVEAMTGAWDPDRPTEGAYAAILRFQDGSFATLAYSGYGYFDSDVWMGWTGELGFPKDPEAFPNARRAAGGFATPEAEQAAKRARTFSGAANQNLPSAHEHFGPVIVSCTRGALRLTPTGVWSYAAEGARFVDCPIRLAPRTGVVDALYGAVRHGLPPRQSGRWGLASLEICLGILDSARRGDAIRLNHQFPEPIRK